MGTSNVVAASNAVVTSTAMGTAFAMNVVWDDITTTMGVIDIHVLKPPRISCSQLEIEKIYA